ncbi:MAG: hypothetical protein U0L88_09615 [Acutalibacteraceae bacterium]|nr:hypothetical protein [Acutalibacteraceae bacterium]
MRLGTAIECLVDNYKYASDKEWINDKVAWALYHTWKEADRKTENSSEKPNNWEDFFREPTAEERKAVADYIDSISVPTGVNVFDLMDEPQKSCSTCGYSPQTPSCDTCDGYSNWWSLDDEPQTGQPCDGCEYSKPYIEYKCTHHSCKFEDEPETERSE